MSLGVLIDAHSAHKHAYSRKGVQSPRALPIWVTSRSLMLSPFNHCRLHPTNNTEMRIAGLDQIQQLVEEEGIHEHQKSIKKPSKTKV